ncbi:MAG TPA: AAA family ATPase [Flexivirga sp.]|uniref:AAA family ATPase n=1 Tax=Flexivirga sp. TaxID=1962927 RepID=UPI002CBB3F3E|nr:AAA family ATPase [Flexivirga sp.]HWC24651.1 AAA family ATPase [Flexivirga sp.]
MTARFRIDQFRLETNKGPVTYDFPDDLTVLAGDTGVGKTTLFELIKFALGGDGLVAPVAAASISEVSVSILAGRERLELARELDNERNKNVRITDLITGDVRPRVPLTGSEPTVSDTLMAALGLPTTMRAAARSAGSSSKGNLITFNDVFKYMYVPQAAINQEIAGSRDSYYDPKRKSVFEILFGLTDADVLAWQSEVNVLNGQVKDTKREADTVVQFLVASGMTLRTDTEIALANAIAEQREGEQTLVRLTTEVEDAVDRETQVLRQMLAESEQSLNEAEVLVASLERERGDYRSERRQLEQDLARLSQLSSAGARLANIEFAVCPRCTQSLSNRVVEPGACRVCLQPDTVKDLPDGQYETAQLTDQIDEVDRQLGVIARQSDEARNAVESRRNLVASLTDKVEVRTANRVTPRLQAYTDAAATVARAKTQQEHLEYVLHQWDRADDIEEYAQSLERKRSELKQRIDNATKNLAARRDSVMAELNAEFKSTVAAFRIPAGQGASIDPKSYLPLLDGRPFNEVSSAGGIATATQVAYWMSLLAVAVRMNDTPYPGFLMIDSPRLAVNSSEDISGQMYSRFVTQVGVVEGRLQFVVADNEMPSTYVREFTEFKFSYDNPTVSTVPHPGPAAVTPIVVSVENED